MRRIWAVARHGFIEGLRSRLTALFVGLFIATIILVAIISEGASPRDQMQTFLSYSVGLISLAMSVMTILLTCGVLCREVDRRYVFISLTKPVARWQHILGRWLGVCLLQAALLAVCGLAIYGTAHYIRYSAGVTDPEHPLNSEVMCARISRRPTDVPRQVKEKMQQRVEHLKAQRVYESRIREIGAEAMDQSVFQWAVAELESVSPGGTLRWEFDKLPKPADTGRTIQFRLKLAAGNALPLEELQRELLFENPTTGQEYRLPVRFPVQAPKTIQLPSWLITEAGSLKVGFRNVPPEGSFSPIQTPVTISMDQVRLLYRVGGFGPNFIRAIILVWLLQAFLAALCVLTASWLSFPVACLWSIVLYVIGLMAAFVVDSTMASAGGGLLVTVGQHLAKAVLWLLPDFARVNPNDDLIGGLLISWGHVADAALWFLVIWPGILLLSAALIFTRRELARVIAE